MPPAEGGDDDGDSSGEEEEEVDDGEQVMMPSRRPLPAMGSLFDVTVAIGRLRGQGQAHDTPLVGVVREGSKSMAPRFYW